MEGDKGVVCVTDAISFLSSWLIARLLEHGYSVRALIARPNPDGTKDPGFLRNLPGASKRLEIFHVDIDDPDSFEPAIAGCTGVFHVGAPEDLRESQEIMARMEMNGTMGILKLCLKYKSSVKRVVLTSGASSVAFNNKNAETVDETFFSEEEKFRELNSQGLSAKNHKLLTEKAALKFAEEHGLDLVLVIRSFLVGPFTCPYFPPSNRSFLALILGNREEYGAFESIPLVHVDDLARANIFLFEYPEAKGRYICSSHSITNLEMAEFLSANYPEYPIPSIDSLAQIKAYKLPRLSTKKLLDTGFQYRHGIDEMLNETIQCCKQKGYI